MGVLVLVLVTGENKVNMHRISFTGASASLRPEPSTRGKEIGIKVGTKALKEDEILVKVVAKP